MVWNKRQMRPRSFLARSNVWDYGGSSSSQTAMTLIYFCVNEFEIGVAICEPRVCGDDVLLRLVPMYDLPHITTKSKRVSEWDWFLNVTCNDISVIYVTAHRCAGGLKKKLNLRFGSLRRRHFVGFFNVPVQAPTWLLNVICNDISVIYVTADWRKSWTYGSAPYAVDIS